MKESRRKVRKKEWERKGRKKLKEIKMELTYWPDFSNCLIVLLHFNLQSLIMLIMLTDYGYLQIYIVHSILLLFTDMFQNVKVLSCFKLSLCIANSLTVFPFSHNQHKICRPHLPLQLPVLLFLLPLSHCLCSFSISCLSQLSSALSQPKKGTSRCRY